MLVGVNKKLITPKESIDLAGFGTSDRKAVGVHDDLYITTLALQHGDKRILIICGDIIGFGFNFTKRIKEDIHEKFGFNEDEILLNASHTHSGPQTLENMLVSVGEMYHEYMENLHNYVISSAESALNSMDKVDIYYGETQCNICINRRLITDGKANFQPNEKGIADKAVTVLKFMKGNMVKAVLFSYACHPSIVGTKYISSDYPGAAKKVIEDGLGKDTVALFMQGCCGNIRARTVEGNSFRTGTWDDVENFGNELGTKVVDLCNGKMKKASEAGMDISSQIIHLQIPIKDIPEKKKLEAIKKSGSTDEKLWAAKMLDKYSSITDTLPFVVQRITLSDDISIITMSGEVCIEYGLYVKNKNPDKIIIPVAYSNGVTGYIPTEEMFSEGGYEPYGSTIYYSFPSQLDTSVEKIVVDALDKIIKN
ncbi:MAG TPA: neutral/alkaline non-lysosomal ceramidase N-terminal domain-containing protein [Clostridiales bacterium]|nr:neutral/alkaline non-lysosomal ceramidase N-terminal domain-containing protein [Clostridiales bacterium]